MGRRLSLAIVVAAVLWLVTLARVARAQYGPDEGGATLKTPFDVLPPAKAPAKPSANYVESVISKTADKEETANPPTPLQYVEKPDINKDLHVTASQGQWMIMVQSYTGPNAPTMARDMVNELRSHYKLAAFTFSYGAEERKKEFDRVKGVIDKQRDYLKKNNLPLDQPIRVRIMRIEEQVGVLVGGYPSEEAAKRALNDLRKLPAPDPKKVQLDSKFVTQFDRGEKPGAPGIKEGSGPFTPTQVMQGDVPGNAQKVHSDRVYVNPFKTAFLCRNPAAKQERPQEWDKLDVTVLKRMNAHEPYNLLGCKKSVTLAVKLFPTPATFEEKNSPGLLESIGLVKSKERDDAAATMAHGVAELLRKAKLEAYVLHTKYSSVVTVGGFDGLDDPALRSMQELLESRLPRLLPQIGFFPVPRPMQVPK